MTTTLNGNTRYIPLRDNPSWNNAGVGVGTVTSVGSGAGLTGGPIVAAGTLSVTNDEVDGFTGQTTYATGDILYASAANTLSKLALGSAGDVLTVDAGLPAWFPPSTSGTVTSVSGGSGITTTPNPITGSGTVSLATIANNTLLGNNSGGAAAPTAKTGAEVTALLDTFTAGAKGVCTPSGGGASNFLRADGVWSAPPGATSGTVTSVGSGTGLTGGPITGAGSLSLATIANNTVLGNNSGGAAAPTAKTGAEVTALLDTFSTAATTKGVVPGSNGAGATSFLNGNGGWTVPAGSSGGYIPITIINGVLEGATGYHAFNLLQTVQTSLANLRGSIVITPSTQIEGFATISQATGAVTMAAMSSTAPSAGTVDLDLGSANVCTGAGGGSFVSGITASVSWTLLGTAVKIAAVSWSASSLTVTAGHTPVLKIVNNMTMSGSGNFEFVMRAVIVQN